jgi:hypothetical protein
VSETAVAARVVSMLVELGCDVYQEVAIPGTNDYADIVALRGPELWIVETKTSWSLDLLEQCVARRRHAHRVFAAVPDKKGSRERAALFATLSIGSITIPSWHDSPARIEVWPPRLVAPRSGKRRRNFPAELRARLAEGHKTHAPAGSPGGGGRFTPYVQTCEQLRDLVARQPGITLKAAIERITHHYASLQSARGSLAKWIAEGKVPGVHAKSEDRALRLYPGCDLCIAGAAVSGDWHPPELAQGRHFGRACAAVRGLR